MRPLGRASTLEVSSSLFSLCPALRAVGLVVMAVDALFLSSGLGLADFFNRFVLDVGSFLPAVRKANGVVSGPEVVAFMAGGWNKSLRENPRALVLDVLCYGPQARSVLERVLARSGYHVSRRCRHHLGEWTRLSADRVTCLVRGTLCTRVVHLVELCRPVVETLLSRVYGTMAGNYITGSGRMVSLFPHLTFHERRFWSSPSCTRREGVSVARKYPAWRRFSGSDEPPEVGAAYRSTTDRFCWGVQFGPGGALVRSCPPDWSG